MKIPAALTREWNAKLKASGFLDLEGADRDGPLSDRGNLHPVEQTEDEIAALGHRIASGSEYTAWAEGVMHSRRLRSAFERRVWARHVAGESLREIADAEGCTYHDARDVVVAVKERGNKGKQGKETETWRKSRLRRLTLETSQELAAAVLKILTPSSTLRSGSSGATSDACKRVSRMRRAA